MGMGSADQISWPDRIGLAACIMATLGYSVFLTWPVTLLDAIVPLDPEQRSLAWFAVDFPMGLLKFELISAVPIWLIARFVALALDRLSSGPPH
jgi:hypothetical protein